MNAGMLWFDNDPKTALSAKVERAAAYYEKKYGKRPNLCLIHPTETPIPDPSPKSENTLDSGEGSKIMVRPYRPVLPGHLWIGVEEEK